MEFIQFNNNPKKKRGNDCVVRAISFATQTLWEDVYMMLAKIGVKKALMPNNDAVWKFYLKTMGYVQQKMPKREDGTRYTLKEFSDEIAEDGKTYIVSIAKHLTVIKNKKLYDTFDCSKKSVGNYWVIEGDNDEK